MAFVSQETGGHGRGGGRMVGEEGVLGERAVWGGKGGMSSEKTDQWTSGQCPQAQTMTHFRI